MAHNLPDDWGSYYRRCGCGARYHASEGGCGDCQPCERCGDVFDDDERGPYNPEICLSCDVVECTECRRELESGKESDEGECPACAALAVAGDEGGRAYRFSGWDAADVQEAERLAREVRTAFAFIKGYAGRGVFPEVAAGVSSLEQLMLLMSRGEGDYSDLRAKKVSDAHRLFDSRVLMDALALAQATGSE